MDTEDDLGLGETVKPRKHHTADGSDGSNRKGSNVSTVNPDDIAKDQLLAFVERIERLEEEKKGVADDIKEIFAEAKGNGFDVKVLRKVLAIRKQDADERAEQEAILDLYLQALGMPTI